MRMSTITDEQFRKTLDNNIVAQHWLIQMCLPGMIENGWGRIVNMSSVSAQRGGGVFGKVPYSSAKAAVAAASPRVNSVSTVTTVTAYHRGISRAVPVTTG